MRPVRRTPCRTLAAVLLAAFAVAALGACKRKHEGIVLGLYASMTGAEAEFGFSTRNGVQLAIDEVNARGGIMGQRVHLVVEDTRGDSNEAASAVTRLIDREGSVGVLGEIASSLSLAGGRVAQRRHTPMISPSSTNETVTQVGNYIFRVCFIDPFQGAVMASFARQRGWSRVAIFQDQGSAYSTGLASAFHQTFTRMGGQIVDEQSYRASDTHFSAQLGSILRQNPDAIFVPGYYTNVALIAREARGLGFRGAFMGGDGWDAPALYQNDDDALVGSFFSESFAPDHPVTPTGQHFVEAYRARYHTDANGLAALGYDAALVMMDAIRRANSLDTARIRDAIAATRDFEGATGVTTLDAHRNAVKSAVVLAVEPNSFRFQQSVEPSQIQ
jgi:branched-chain amino acid transport system substrate-binding protein